MYNLQFVTGGLKGTTNYSNYTKRNVRRINMKIFLVIVFSNIHKKSRNCMKINVIALFYPTPIPTLSLH